MGVLNEKRCNIYALNKSHVERIKKQSPENTKKYEDKEECSQERINFDNPNIRRITQNALKTVIDGDVQILVNGYEDADKTVAAVAQNVAAVPQNDDEINQKSNNQGQNTDPSAPPFDKLGNAGGSSFRKRKTYKLPRKIIFRHRTF